MLEPSEDAGCLAACEKWLRCNYDTGAAKTALPEAEDKPSVETGKYYRTASGEVIPDFGKGTLCGTDESGRFLRLNGQVTKVHKILVSASAVHSKENFSWIESGGGYIIPVPLGKKCAAPISACLRSMARVRCYRFGRRTGCTTSIAKERRTLELLTQMLRRLFAGALPRGKSFSLGKS